MALQKSCSGSSLSSSSLTGIPVIESEKYHLPCELSLASKGNLLKRVQLTIMSVCCLMMISLVSPESFVHSSGRDGKAQFPSTRICRLVSLLTQPV